MYRKATILYFVAVLTIIMIVGCAATLPTDFDRPESYALTETNDTDLGRSRAAEQAAHPGKSSFYLLDDGLDA